MVTIKSKRQPSFTVYMHQQIAFLRSVGRVRTAETYAIALRSFQQFMAMDDIHFSHLTCNTLSCYEAHLKQRGNVPNTISFYMRNLKAVYNKAVDEQLTSQLFPFKNVYTGIDKTCKRAIPLSAIKQIKHAELDCRPHLEWARLMFLFCFYTRGMSFVDMAYLRKIDVAQGILTYRRRKTGQRLSIRWEPCMQHIVDSFPPNETPFLLPIITRKGVDYRSQYVNAQHRSNRLLKQLGQHLDLSATLTMYVARHSWASIAHGCNVPLAVISEGMGHNSEATTQIYLASIDTSVVDEANKTILNLL